MVFCGDDFHGVGGGFLVHRPSGHAFHFPHVAGTEARGLPEAGCEFAPFDFFHQGGQDFDALGGFFHIPEGAEFFDGGGEDLDRLAVVVVVRGIGGFFHREAGALRGYGGDDILVEADVGGVLGREDANRLRVGVRGDAGSGEVVPEDFEFHEALAFERGRGFAGGQERQREDIEHEGERGGLAAREVAEGDFDAAVGEPDGMERGEEDPVLAEVEFADPHANILAGGALQALELGLENGGEFFGGIRIVEIPAGAGGEFFEQGLVVVVAEAEGGCADARAPEAVGDEMLDLAVFHDAFVQEAVA